MGVQKRPHDDDPLSRVLAPPPNETPEEKETRLRLEAEARQISDKIDEQLKAERSRLRALTAEQAKANREKETVLLDLRRTESVSSLVSWCWYCLTNAV